MRCRTVGIIITLTLGLLAVPLVADSQPPAKLPRVGYLTLAPGPSPRTEALRQGLRELGYVEGQSITMEYRFVQGNLDQLRKAAAELVRLPVDVIVSGGPTVTQAAKEATRTIPIVMALDFDPIGAGFVASLARPGGNITGLTDMTQELNAKRLQLLQEAVAGVSRIAVLWNPTHINAALSMREMEEAARVLGLQLQPLEVQRLEDFEGAFRAALQGRADALIVLSDPVTLFNRTPLVDLAAQHRLPAMYWERVFAEAGGLMSYAASDRDLHRRAASYVDKILKGTKLSDLPVERPMKFELVLNLKTAKALGIMFPPTLLMQADEVFQ